MKLNDFFSNTLINLKITKFEIFYPLSECIDHSTLKAIVNDTQWKNVIQYKN